jgi:hypothetical protein
MSEPERKPHYSLPPKSELHHELLDDIRRIIREKPEKKVTIFDD